MEKNSHHAPVSSDCEGFVQWCVRCELYLHDQVRPVVFPLVLTVRLMKYQNKRVEEGRMSVKVACEHGDDLVKFREYCQAYHV